MDAAVSCPRRRVGAADLEGSYGRMVRTDDIPLFCSASDATAVNRSAQMMDRRSFLIASAVSATACMAPGALLAQISGDRPLRLALVSGAFRVEELAEGGTRRYGIVLSELRRLGFVEGQNLIVERWSNAGHPESELPDLAKHVVASQPDIIYLTASSVIATIKAATSTIPVVFYGLDPVGWGFVDSLSRPGGNLTGFSADAGPEFYMKELQLLTEAAQTNQIIYLLTDATKDTPASGAVRDAARQLGVNLRPAIAEGTIDEASISKALSGASPVPGLALFVHPAVVLRPFAGFIASHALRFHLPTLSNSREGAEAGFVLSYIALDDEAYRGIANYIARIAGGSKPADLPVQQPELYDFVVNLKTAKAIGITIPASILAQATQVIE